MFSFLFSSNNKRQAPGPPETEHQNKRPHTESDAAISSTASQLVPLVSRTEAAEFWTQPDQPPESRDFQTQPDAAITNSNTNGYEFDDDIFQDAPGGDTFTTDAQESHYEPSGNEDGTQKPLQQPTESAVDFVAEDEDGNPLYEDWGTPPGAKLQQYSHEQVEDMMGMTGGQEQSIDGNINQAGAVDFGGAGDVMSISSDNGQTNFNVADQRGITGTVEEGVMGWDETDLTFTLQDAAAAAAQNGNLEIFDLTDVADQYGSEPQQNGHEQQECLSTWPQPNAQQHVRPGTSNSTLQNIGFFNQDYNRQNFPPNTSHPDVIGTRDDDTPPDKAVTKQHAPEGEPGEEAPQFLGTVVEKDQGDEQIPKTTEDDDQTNGIEGDLFASAFGNREKDAIPISDDDDDEETNQPRRRLSTPPLAQPNKPSPPKQPKKPSNTDPPLRPGPDLDRDLSPLLRETYKFHARVYPFLQKLPSHHLNAMSLSPHRYWIAVLLEGKTHTKNIRSEKDFIWIKGSKYTTVKTVRESYLTTMFCEERGLEIRLGGGERVHECDVMGELDYFGNHVVCFRAVRVAEGHEGRGGSKTLVPNLIQEVVEID